MKISDREIGPGHPPFIVAEISGEHKGSVKRGYEMIDAAIAAGASAIKLQCYTADTLTFRGEGDEFKIMDGPWAGRTLHDLYSEAETPKDLLAKMVRYGQKRGAIMFASAFSLEDIDFLVSLNVPAIKIASFELVDLPLIQKASSTGLPVIISTGMGKTSEIVEAMHAFGQPTRKLALLHCVSEYPASPRDANLPALGPLSELLGGSHVVGLSDHTLGRGVACAAVAFGASIIEKHLTLSRSNGGADAGFSLEPDEFVGLVEICNEAWQAIQSCPPKIRHQFAQFRKSLYVVKDVSCGDSFSKENVRIIRPARGLAPKFYQSVLAGAATRDLKAGTPIERSMVSSLC